MKVHKLMKKLKLKIALNSISRKSFNFKLDPNIHMQDYIELRSDVKTLPTQKMRESILSCIVGDDCSNEDSTMKELQQRIQTLFGKERALFVPTGFMGNMAAISLNAKRDDFIIQGDFCHIWKVEYASQELLGFKPYLLENLEDGTLNLKNDEFLKLLKNPDLTKNFPVLSLENTHNFKGGRVLPKNYSSELKKKILQDLPKIKFHLDGSRIFNSSIFLNEDLKLLVKDFDTVNICLSKGIGAPVGSMILCDDSQYEKLRHIRKAMGGSMRQSGLLASFALVALDDWKERMKKDNLKAIKIANGLNNIRNVKVFPSHVESNIVIIYVDQKYKSKLEEAVKILATQHKVNIGYISYTGQLRVVTHHQVDDQQIAYAVEKMNKVFSDLFND